MDFFTVPTLAFGVLYCFFVIAHDRRRNPPLQRDQASEQCLGYSAVARLPYDSAPGYLIFDRDASFNEEVIDTVKSFGIRPKRTSFRSPWQNGVAERWVGNCRRDLLDHVIFTRLKFSPNTVILPVVVSAVLLYSRVEARVEHCRDTLSEEGASPSRRTQPGRSRAPDRRRGYPLSSHPSDDALCHRCTPRRSGPSEGQRHRQPTAVLPSSSISNRRAMAAEFQCVCFPPAAY